MEVFELFVKAYCLQDISKKEVLEQVANLIDTCLMKKEEMKSVHLSNRYKYYSFNSLFPLEQDGVYKKGNLYTFILRTADNELKKYFTKHLAEQYNSVLKLLTVDYKSIPKKYIQRIYTVTPVILKFNNGYWKNEYNAEVFERRLRENLIKKYNYFNKEKLQEDFELFTYMKLDNQKPIAFKCKDINLLGDKVTLHIADNAFAQQLAYIAISSGLGELGARGAGFVNYKFL